MVCLILLLTSCAVSHPQSVQVSLQLLHAPGAFAERTVALPPWQVALIPALPGGFEVYRLRVGDREYLCDDLLNVYDSSHKNAIVISSDLKNTLVDIAAELKDSAYAPPIPWAEAARLFPRMAIADVTDLATGMTFRVQRRGGTYHADVQPLTKADTAVMKEIYGGIWSWDRRAVIVSANGYRIAASMNGMPHGQGALDNNFSGHFCIHFLNSVTHGTHALDLGHQLMIHKAAGSIYALTRSATPEQQVMNMAAALNQKDLWLAQLFLSPVTTAELGQEVAKFEIIELNQAMLVGPTTDTCQVQLSGEVVYHGGSRHRVQCVVDLRVIAGVWRVEVTSIKNILSASDA